jgi:hypothetical protein
MKKLTLLVTPVMLAMLVSCGPTTTKFVQTEQPTAITKKERRVFQSCGPENPEVDVCGKGEGGEHEGPPIRLYQRH